MLIITWQLEMIDDNEEWPQWQMIDDNTRREYPMITRHDDSKLLKQNLSLTKHQILTSVLSATYTLQEQKFEKSINGEMKWNSG